MPETSPNLQTAVLGGGCFWCTEAIFRRLNGVTEVVSGYAGGKLPRPSYEKVSMGTTGHAEVIKIIFDPEIISFDRLLDVFFAVHDATQRDGQGADIGTQYRSIILATTPEQELEARAKLEEMQAQVRQELATELQPLQEFFNAEEYHQKYYDRQPSAQYCSLVISPKLKKLQQKFPELIRKQTRN